MLCTSFILCILNSPSNYINTKDTRLPSRLLLGETKRMFGFNLMHVSLILKKPNVKFSSVFREKQMLPRTELVTSGHPEQEVTSNLY